MSAEKAAEFNVEWMELEKLWPLVDYVTVHTPLIPQTKGDNSNLSALLVAII